MIRLINWLDKNHIAIVFSIAILAIVSIYTYGKLPKDVFPRGEFPRFQIIADIGFASLQETEIRVTRPIEEALKGVPNVTEIRSATERGTSTIDIYLNWEANLNQAFQYIQSQINETKGVLQNNIDISVTPMTTSAFPMSEYGVWSDAYDQEQLYSLVKYTIIPKLIGVEGVYGLSVIGGMQPEVWVKFNPDQLIKYNLDTATISNALSGINQVSFVGKVYQDGDVLFATVGNQLSDIRALENIVVATRMGKPVYLKDIANVGDFHEPQRRIVSIDGHEGLIIDVQKQQNADSVKLSKILDEKFDEISKEFKGDLHVTKWDLSEFVASSIHSIMFDIVIAIFIILMITYYIMHRFRFALPIIIVLPIIILFEFLVIKALGLNINIMTLGGLSAAIGIVADNAIVITENYVRFKSERKTNNVLAESMSYILPITIWATLVSIVVFIPLNILSGVSGMFFKPLALTLSTTIIISLIMAVFVMPVFIKYFIENYKGELKERKERYFFAKAKEIYIKLLNVALRAGVGVVGLTALFFLLGIYLFLKIPTGFLPEWDEGDIVFDYIAPAGTSIDGANEMMAKVEAIVEKIPEVKMYVRKTGTHLSVPYAAPNVGEIIILLNKDRDLSTFQVMDKLRREVSAVLPDLETDFHQILPDRIGDLTGISKPVVVNVIGDDIQVLMNAALEIQKRLEKVEGLNSVIIDMPPPQKEIKLSVNQENASLLGVNVGDIYRYAQLALYGEVVSNFQKGLQTIPIRMLYQGDYMNKMDDIEKIPIYTPNGGVLPLGKIATFTLADEITEIHHKNGSLVVNINAEISGRSLGNVVTDVKNILSSLPRGDYTTELAGSYQGQRQSFLELIEILIISVVLILVFLLFIFESYKTALTVFIGTLCSASFVIFGLFLTRTEFNVSSFTGMITVMGIVVNNGILVVYFIERFRKTQSNIIDAINEACDLRFRPVLITNLAAMAGFLPMALNIGQGGEILQPFSIAMISGLVGSMFFSLVVMPTFYLIGHRKSAPSTL